MNGPVCSAVGLGSFLLGLALGYWRVGAARADVATWRQLAEQLHDENSRLRLSALVSPRKAEPGEPNALARLRKRLRFGRGEVAQSMGVPVADVEETERTPLAQLDLGIVDRYVGALGCRLDVVAQHIDGEAIWLSGDERGRS